MNHSKISDQLSPILALIIYEANEESSFYIECRRVLQSGALGAARPLQKNTLKQIGEFLYKKAETMLFIDGIIDPRVIHLKTKPENESIIWYHKASKQQLLFEEKLGIESREYPVPNLIFKLSRHELSVFAVIEPRETLKDDTELYIAPYPNISTRGTVCMGNAFFEWKNQTSEKELIAEIEKRFFLSHFSHHASDNLTKGNYIFFMKSLKETFPDNKLLKHKKVLHEIY